MEPNQTPVVDQSQVSVSSEQVATQSAPEEAPKKKFDFKIVLAVIVALVLFLLLFVFLKNKFSSNTNQSSGGEIVWWGLWEDDQTVKSLISDYEAKNPKVKIKYVKQSKEDYRERLTNALAKGTGPDIFRFHNTWVPMFKNELDKMPTSVYSASDFANTFYPVAVSDLTLGNSIVGIPLEYDGLVLYINEDIFEKAGKSVPTNWNDLRTVARELTVTDQNKNITQSGVALGRTENVDHWAEILALMMLQNGVDLTKPTGQLAEDALNFFVIFSNDDKVWDATLPSSTVAFASGKLAMYFGPSWRSFEIRNQNPNLRFKTVPVPQLPKLSADEPDVNYASYWAEGVWTRSTKKAEAWKFLKYLSEKENQQKFYDSASKIRMFGEPYSRMDMSESLLSHPIAGAVISEAKTAQTWFLQTKTWDGSTGINSQITKYFEDAVNAVNSGKEVNVSLATVASGVAQVLTQYGIRIQ